MTESPCRDKIYYMETLRDSRPIKGVNITAFKQNGAQILCKILITPGDAIELCKRTKSGLYKNKEFHERFVNMIVTQLDSLIEEDREKLNGKS